MARPRLSEGTRMRLLDASVSAFLVQGYHGTGIKDLLDQVHVPKGSFYNYFASKEELGVAAIRHYAAQFVADLNRELDAAPDPLTGLRAFFGRLIEEFDEAGCVGGCLLANLAGELDDSAACNQAIEAGFRSWRDAVRDALAQAQRLGTVRGDIDATALADILTDGWEGAVIRMKIERSVTPLRRFLEHLLDGYFRP